MTKYKNKNLNILRAKTAFEVKYVIFFIFFNCLSVAKNCLRHDSAPLKLHAMIACNNV